MVCAWIGLLQVLEGGDMAMVHVFVVDRREWAPFQVAKVLESSVDLSWDVS